MPERGVAGAEVVERNFAAKVANLGDEIRRLFDIVEGPRFGDFDDQPLGDIARIPKQGEQQTQPRSVAGGQRRHVDGEGGVLVFVELADGGFQADRARLGRHITGRPDRIRQRNTETGRGDGLHMAEEAGAATVGLDKFYGHVLSRDVMTDPMLWPYPQVDVICASGIVVGADAKRFTDEGLGGVYITNEIARLDDPLSATAIFDSTVWEQAKEADLVPPNPLLVEAGGTLHTAGSIGELALRSGLDTGTLEVTVAAFNAAAKAGRTAALTPARTADRYTPVPIETPPFHAIPLAAGITVTMGGIAVDGAARVLRPDDTPIPGLYAAGSTVGGVEGGPNAAYIGGLIKAFLLGLVAAETAAREIEAAN